MAHISAGKVNTADNTIVQLHVENRTERGRFVTHMAYGGQVIRLEHEQARELAERLQEAADKAEILDAAMA